MTHICIGNLTFIGSDNDLSPGRRQAIIWNNAGILLIGPLGTNFNEISIEIHTFSFKKMHFKMSSAKWLPFCLGLNVLTHRGRVRHVYLSKLDIIDSDYGLSPIWHQAIISTTAVSWTLRNKSQWNVKQNITIFIQENEFENVICKMAAILYGRQCVKLTRSWPAVFTGLSGGLGRNCGLISGFFSSQNYF